MRRPQTCRSQQGLGCCCHGCSCGGGKWQHHVLLLVDAGCGVRARTDRQSTMCTWSKRVSSIDRGIYHIPLSRSIGEFD